VLGLLGLGAAFFGPELEQGEVVVEVAPELLDAGDFLFDVGALAEQRLRFGLIVPESGRSGPIVQLIELPLEGRDVKDAPLAS
jgi:hypothetical protein